LRARVGAESEADEVDAVGRAFGTAVAATAQGDFVSHFSVAMYWDG
jgi:hypothetical protein